MEWNIGLKWGNIIILCRFVLNGTTRNNFSHIPVDIYLLKVNNRNTRTRFEIYSKLTIKTPERRHWSRSGVFIVNFKHILHLAPVFILNMQLPDGIQQKQTDAFSNNRLLHFVIIWRGQDEVNHDILAAV